MTSDEHGENVNSLDHYTFTADEEHARETRDRLKKQYRKVIIIDIHNPHRYLQLNF